MLDWCFVCVTLTQGTEFTDLPLSTWLLVPSKCISISKVFRISPILVGIKQFFSVLRTIFAFWILLDFNLFTRSRISKNILASIIVDWLIIRFAIYFYYSVAFFSELDSLNLD